MTSTLMENAFGLVVGIANYSNIQPLPKTVIKDARAFFEILIDQEYCAYPFENVQLLLNEQATKKSVEQALKKLATQSNEDSTVVIYLSSHGGQIPEGPYAGQYILPVNVNASTFAAVAQTSISGEDFTNALEAIPARKILVLFDCCHSGGIGQIAGDSSSELQSGLNEDLYDELKKGKGRVIIASSRGNEESYVLPGAENSLFTTYVLEGLKGEIPGEDGLIKVFDLFEYVQPLVTGTHPRQHPVFKAELEENFPIALYQGGKFIPKIQEDFKHDVYVSYIDKEPDADWVWENLIPRLEAAKLSVAVSEDVMEAGVARVVSIERGIKQSRYIISVLSPQYMSDNMSQFENNMSIHMGAEEARARVIPVVFEKMPLRSLSLLMRQMVILDFTKTFRARGGYSDHFDQLIGIIQKPIKSTGYFACDVFLTYAQENREWVIENLLPLLSQAGLKTAVSDSKIWTGKPMELTLDSGLRQSKRVIAIISNDFMKNPALFEEVLAKTYDDFTGESRLTTLLIEPTELPAEIAQTSIDLTNPVRAPRRLKRLVIELQEI